jgi:predicted nucleic acid-binding protein
LVTKRRSTTADEAQLLQQFRDFLNSDIDYRNVDLDAAISLAGSLKLSVYDACYLTLAQTHGIELVTLDKRLATAAAKIGVKT